MKALNRGLAILLAGVLILGSGVAFAVSPNANPKAMKINPAKMKAIEKIGLEISDVMDIVDDVDVDVVPMANGNVGVIIGKINLDEDYEFEGFKGNIKLKVKLNNVTVNIDEFGEFAQSMPVWKIEPLSVRVYMGKMLVYSSIEEEIEGIDNEINIERALDRAEAAIDRLPDFEDLEEDLTIDDFNLIRRARIAVDILGEAVEDNSDEEDLYEEYLLIVEAAEEIMRDIVEELIEWEIELDEISEGAEMYYGKLAVDRTLSENLMVIVDFDSPEEDVELEVAPNGHVWFQTDEEGFEVRVELDGEEIEDLTVDFD